MNLFIDTSNSYLIFVLFKDDQVIDTVSELTNKNQSEIFFERLDSFLSKNEVKISMIENFYFGSGPGSFTGIRVGLTFAKGLRVSQVKNVYTISSLELLLDDKVNTSAAIPAHSEKYFYVEKIDGAIQEARIIKKEELSETYNTYETAINDIPTNLIRLVKDKRYSEELNPQYLKEAF